MTFIATALFTIDIIKLLNIVINRTNSSKIYMLFIVIFFIIFFIIFIIIIGIVVDIKQHNFADELLLVNLKLKEEKLKKNSLYVMLCKLLHIFKVQSVIYYHTRMYMFFVKYEVMKWYIYKYGFINYIKEVISIKFDKIDIILLSYYYRWLVLYDSSEMREEIRLNRERENAIKISIIKKIRGITTEEITLKEQNTEEILNIIKSKEYKDLLENNQEYINIQLIKKKYNEQIKINGTLNTTIEKNIYYLKFSNFYFKLNHIFFHYSLILFWLMTTTKIWFIDLKIKLVDPYIKAHSKYLIYQTTDNVTLRRKIDYQNNSTFELMGHSKTVEPKNNYYQNDIPLKNRVKYKYHFRTDGYSETSWYVNRDNQVWGHYSGTGLFSKKERGLQTWHSYISRTDWGSDLNFSSEIVPKVPSLKSYFKNYRYIGYPERFFDYTIDMCYYFLDLIIYKTMIIVPDIYDVDCNTNVSLVINFSLLFLLVLFQIWSIITVLLISKRVQIIVKENFFYFIMMFLFSIFIYLLTFLPYFDHNFIIDSWIYIIKLPFTYLKFNISDTQFIYIAWLSTL